MSTLATLFILILAFVTALISGVFGMAGGLILMGGLGLVLTVPQAMTLHGLIQALSNGSRAGFLLSHVRWGIIGVYSLGALAAAGLVFALAVQPSPAMLYVALGLVPFLTWLPAKRLRLDASRRLDAIVCGFLVSGLNLSAGVAGPLLDVFFVRSELTRHQVVATKAATQTISHAAKIAIYGAPILAAAPGEARQLGLMFVIAAPLTLAGTWVGARLLERWSDVSFRKWTRIVVTAAGVVFLVRGALLLA
ncbi:MAG: TSUP family transporter [Maricaulaceae bacterium]|jgi:uncharacterized membrane protein YfcA